MINFDDIVNHAITDPNAKYHQKLGLIACVISVIATSALCMMNHDILPLLIFPGAVFSSLIMGISIELYQRLIRIGKQHNTLRESILDIMVTWLFPLMFIINK